MNAYKIKYSDELYHHGILGQKWGVRRFQNSDGSLTSEGKERYGRSGSKRSLKLTDKQKKIAKIGAAVVVTGLAAYGVYSIYKKNPSVLSDGKVFNLTESSSISKIEHPTGGIPKQLKPESFKESLSKANPYIGKPEGVNICNQSALSGFLRSCKEHYDVVAKPNGGKMLDLGGMVEEVFPGIETMKPKRMLDGSAVRFGKSVSDAKAMLVERFGKNAEGVVGIQWKNADYGHTFNWVIKDGEVSFIDYSQASDDVIRYWRQIDPQGHLTLARLDGLIPNEDTLKKYCG